MPTYLTSTGVGETGVAAGNVVTISNPPDGMTTTSSTVTVTGMATPGSTVTVNGIPVDVDSSGNFSVEIALESGSNIITIIATDPNGASETVTRTVTYNAGAVELPSWLLSVVAAGGGLLAIIVLMSSRKR